VSGFFYRCLFTPGHWQWAPKRRAARKGLQALPARSWRWLAWLLPPLFFGAMDWFVQQAAVENKAITKNGAMWARIGNLDIFWRHGVSWILRGQREEFSALAGASRAPG